MICSSANQLFQKQQNLRYWEIIWGCWLYTFILVIYDRNHSIKKALDKSNDILLLTADHGNCEVMMHEKFKTPHTAHTCNKVPLILISKDNSLKLQNGKLADVAPTILDLMALAIPKSMNGKSLLIK